MAPCSQKEFPLWTVAWVSRAKCAGEYSTRWKNAKGMGEDSLFHTPGIALRLSFH